MRSAFFALNFAKSRHFLRVEHVSYCRSLSVQGAMRWRGGNATLLRAMAVAGFVELMALLLMPSALAEEAKGVVEPVDLDRGLLSLAGAVDVDVIGQGESIFIVFEHDDRDRKVVCKVLLAVQEQGLLKLAGR